MTVTRPRRGFVEVLVYATDQEEGEPVGEWEMPNALRYDLEYAALIAERQTRRETKTEGDSA